jgi:pilin isopeptide linkage protein
VLLLSLALVGTILTGPTFAYVMTQTSSLINTFISGLVPEGGIVIRKAVEHPFGESYEIPEHIGFGFRVELGQEYAGKTVSTSQGSQTADSEGNIIVTVKPGSSVAIREITAGTSVTVTELAQSPGFTVADGTVSQTVNIVARKDTTVRFVNIYTPAPVPDANLEVIGIKNLEGRPWQPGDRFTFGLEYRYLGDDAQWTELGTASVTYDPTVEGFNCFDLTQLVKSVDYSQVGTYAFRVSEVKGVIGGITYDELISYFDVQISDADMDGYLEVSKVTGTAGAQIAWDDARQLHCVTMTFSNHYAPTGSAAVSIPIHKVVEDRSGQSHTAEGFTFELYTADGVLVQTSEPTSAAGDTGLRLVYEAAQAGQTFSYVVQETGSGTVVGAMNYDARSYIVRVTVKDNLDGTVSAQADVEQLNFVNIYDPQDATVLFDGTKTLEGRELVDGEFTFQLYATDAEFTVAQDAQPTLTAVNSADGSFSFGPVVYDQVGVYYYLVREDTSVVRRGISYDDSVYHLTVTVTDEAGVLTAQTEVTTPDGQTAQLAYRNIYRPIAAFLQLSGKKVLEGATLTQGQFHFELFTANESFEPEGAAIQTVANTEQGSFSFEPMLYEQTGVYRYIIREKIENQIEGVIYDDTVYAVTVTVTDNGDGALLAQTDIRYLGGEAADEIVFENVYDPNGPDDPNKPDKPDDPEAPKTDHPQPVATYVIMVTLAVALLVMLVLWDKYGWRYRK